MTKTRSTKVFRKGDSFKAIKSSLLSLPDQCHFEITEGELSGVGFFCDPELLQPANPEETEWIVGDGIVGFRY